MKVCILFSLLDWLLKDISIGSWFCFYGTGGGLVYVSRVILYSNMTPYPHTTFIKKQRVECFPFYSPKVIRRLNSISFGLSNYQPCLGIAENLSPLESHLRRFIIGISVKFLLAL
jgi:hypothetical protein